MCLRLARGPERSRHRSDRCCRSGRSARSPPRSPPRTGGSGPWRTNGRYRPWRSRQSRCRSCHWKALRSAPPAAQPNARSSDVSTRAPQNYPMWRPGPQDRNAALLGLGKRLRDRLGVLANAARTCRRRRPCLALDGRVARRGGPAGDGALLGLGFLCRFGLGRFQDGVGLAHWVFGFNRVLEFLGFLFLWFILLRASLVVLDRICGSRESRHRRLDLPRLEPARVCQDEANSVQFPTTRTRQTRRVHARARGAPDRRAPRRRQKNSLSKPRGSRWANPSSVLIPEAGRRRENVSHERHAVTGNAFACEAHACIPSKSKAPHRML